MELAPNIHWIDGVKGNVYACFDREQVTLIGSGRASIDRIDLIFNYLARQGYYPIHLSRIVITHADSDQAGNIADIQAEARLTVYATPQTKEFLLLGQNDSKVAGTADTGFLNRPRKFTTVEGETIQTVGEGDLIPVLGGLYVIPTAGFTAGHMALYAPQSGVLFAGEALPLVNGILQSTSSKITMYTSEVQATIQYLLSLCPTVIACSQGQPLATHTAAHLLQTYV